MPCIILITSGQLNIVNEYLDSDVLPVGVANMSETSRGQ